MHSPIPIHKTTLHNFTIKNWQKHASLFVMSVFLPLIPQDKWRIINMAFQSTINPVEKLQHLLLYRRHWKQNDIGRLFAHHASVFSMQCKNKDFHDVWEVSSVISCWRNLLLCRNYGYLYFREQGLIPISP